MAGSSDAGPIQLCPRRNIKLRRNAMVSRIFPLSSYNIILSAGVLSSTDTTATETACLLSLASRKLCLDVYRVDSLALISAWAELRLLLKKPEGLACYFWNCISTTHMDMPFSEVNLKHSLRWQVDTNHYLYVE